MAPRVLSSFDLVHHILSFCDPTELVKLKLVNKTFCAASKMMIKRMIGIFLDSGDVDVKTTCQLFVTLHPNYVFWENEEDSWDSRYYKVDYETGMYKHVKSSEVRMLQQRFYNRITPQNHKKVNKVEGFFSYTCQLLYDCDCTLLDKFQEQKNLFVFANGVFDFAVNRFRPARGQDYVLDSHTSEYAYDASVCTKASKVERTRIESEIMRWFSSILVNGYSMSDLFTILRRCLVQPVNVVLLRGNAGIIDEFLQILQQLLGCYYYHSVANKSKSVIRCSDWEMHKSDSVNTKMTFLDSSVYWRFCNNNLNHFACDTNTILIDATKIAVDKRTLYGSNTSIIYFRTLPKHSRDDLDMELESRLNDVQQLLCTSDRYRTCLFNMLFSSVQVQVRT